MAFLPSNYEPPQRGNFMKLQPGENRFRVLGSAIVGNEFWITSQDGRHPVRRRMHEVIEPGELGVDQFGGREKPKHFWAFCVWNYVLEQIQVLEITQRTIQESIRGLYESDDWGDPAGYDLIVRKSGSGLETEYSVLPGKPSAPPVEVRGEFEQMSVDLEALFDEGDPFDSAGLALQSSSATNTPRQQDQDQTTVATIGNVREQTNKAGATVWLIDTDQGEFGTRDRALARQAEKLTGVAMNVTWQPTRKGGRLVLSWTPEVQSNQTNAEADRSSPEEDDIPF